MSDFWKYMIKEAIDREWSWERLIGMFPHMDNVVAKRYFDDNSKGCDDNNE